VASIRHKHNGFAVAYRRANKRGSIWEMIYSKFGTALALISKTQNDAGRLSVQATTDGTADTRDYNVADLKADGGLAEINAAIAKLPPKVFENKIGRPQRPL